jgi:hypothetical protein
MSCEGGYRAQEHYRRHQSAGWAFGKAEYLLPWLGFPGSLSW